MDPLNAIVRGALRHRGAVIALALVLFAYGVYALSQAEYDVFPEFAPPQVSVETEAPGFAPEQMEQLVTQPIENALAGTPGVETMRSQSIPGVSVITLNFSNDADIYRERQLVAERLATAASSLPSDVEAPSLTPLFSSTGDALVIGLSSRTANLMTLRTLADWTVRPHLLAVPGVAGVSVFGGEQRELQVQPDRDALVRYHLSMNDLAEAATRASRTEGVGFVDTPNQRLLLRTPSRRLTAGELGHAVIRWKDGVPLTLADVARVVEAPSPAISGATIMGHSAVILKISLQYGANTLAVTRRLDRALKELEPSLRAQGATLQPGLFRAASFIETAVRNVRSSLVLGAVLVAVVLLLFLFNVRSAAISCAAIPLSLIAAVLMLERFGYSLNTMTMGGLAIAIGEVVDDAVIDVENILRRLRENRRSAEPLPAFRVVLRASLEVRGAVVYATFAVVLVFLPIMTLSGLAGRLFAPLGLAYILAILASLGVALTLTPAMSLLLLGKGGSGERESPPARWLRERYRAVLRRVETHFAWVLGATALATLAGLALLPFLSGSFLPTLQEEHLILHMTMAPGTSLEESARQGERLTAALLRVPGIRQVSQKIGHAVYDDLRGPEGSELDLALVPGSDTDDVSRAVLAVVAGYPGASYSVNSFFAERVNETLSGYTAPVVLKLFGEDLDKLDEAAATAARRLGSVRGASGVRIEAPPAAPGFDVSLREGALRQWGVTSGEVLDALKTAYAGLTVGEVHDGSQSYPVALILPPADRAESASIGKLPIRTASGRVVLLGELADLRPSSGRGAILHEAARRVQVVTCGVAGRPVSGFVEEAQRAIEAPGVLPAGVVPGFSGAAGAEAKARRDLLAHSLLAGVGVLLLLTAVLTRRRNVLLVLLNLPFALVGGVLVVALFGGELSLGALVGFVTVFGITLRNAIMLISHYEHLVTTDGLAWNAETALRGASERLVPILMTALVTALGLLPLAIGMHSPGREIEGPMALVILGGLATSTALNLLIMPTLALRFGSFGPGQNVEEQP